MLDDFTLAGAPKVSAGLKLLFSENPGSLRVGCGTTKFRDADGRDMALELFGANPVVERDLVDAWKAGDLTRPLYVGALYSTPRGILGLDSWWSATDPCFKRECCEEYEEIRRLIDQIGNADSVMAKYLRPYPDARVVVFCPTIERARSQASGARDMFDKVNREVHAYEFHSGVADPWANLASFEQDDSPALKALYCVDMLTEDVRLDGVRAVVMTRPTRSNAVFLSQIGRAISPRGMGSDKATIVFDLVNNVVDDGFAPVGPSKQLAEGCAGARARWQMFLEAGCEVMDVLGDPIGILERVRGLEDKYARYRAGASHGSDSVPVVCHETGEVFADFMAAADWVSNGKGRSVKPSQIRQATRTGAAAGGFHWRLYGEEQKEDRSYQVGSVVLPDAGFAPAPRVHRKKRTTAADDRKMLEQHGLDPRDFGTKGDYDDSVYRLSDGRVFSSVGAAAVAMGANPTEIQRMIKSRRPLFGTRLFYYHGNTATEPPPAVKPPKRRDRARAERAYALEHRMAPYTVVDGTDAAGAAQPVEPARAAQSTDPLASPDLASDEKMAVLVRVDPSATYYRTARDASVALGFSEDRVKRALDDGRPIGACEFRYIHCPPAKAEKLLEKSGAGRSAPSDRKVVSPTRPAPKEAVTPKVKKDEPARHAVQRPTSRAIADITGADGGIDVDFLACRARCLETGKEYPNLMIAAIRTGTSLEALTESIRLGEPVDGRTWILA